MGLSFSVRPRLNMQYYSANYFILRTPFFPLLKSLHQPAIEVLIDSSFNEAVYLSSPNLLPEIEKYLKSWLDTKQKGKLELSIYRFYLRAIYRCTPFGLFAGISAGNVANETNIQLCPQIEYKKTPASILTS